MTTTTSETIGLSEGVTATLAVVTAEGVALYLLRCDGDPVGWLRVPADRSLRTEYRPLDMRTAGQAANAWQAAAALCEEAAVLSEGDGLAALRCRANPGGCDDARDERGLAQLDRAARLRARARALRNDDNWHAGGDGLPLTTDGELPY
jgi:hypothetical protein